MKPAILMVASGVLLCGCQSQVSVIGGEKIGEARAQVSRQAASEITHFVLERLGTGAIWDGPFIPEEARMKAAVRGDESWRAFTAADSSRCYFVVYEEVLAHIDFVGSSRHGRAFAPCGVIRISGKTPAVIYKEAPNQSPEPTAGLRPAAAHL